MGKTFQELVADAKTRIKETSVEEVSQRLAGGASFRLIDVREDSEFAAGHLPGAEHLGRGVLERDAQKKLPDPGAEIVVYCGGGFRSALAADTLRQMGYTRVLSMAGGFGAWKKAEFPIEM